MSYDLCFWKQRPGTRTDPQGTYEQLLGEARVAGLDDLPVDRIRGCISETFSEGWQRLDEHNWESAGGSFQVWITPQCFVIHSYGLPGEVLNLFVDIGTEFGCKLYDPQTGERFEG